MSVDNEGIVEQTVRIEARPETVWKYWTDPELLSEWWLGVAELDPRPGGVFGVEMSEGPTMLGEYVELDPFNRLVFSFGWEQRGDVLPIPPGSTRVEVTLQEDAGDTIMVLRHTGLPSSMTGLHGEGWERHLPLLVACVRRDSVA